MKKTGTREARAVCRTCGKEWNGSNAQAVGAKHARHHGHVVDVDVTLCYTYEG